MSKNPTCPGAELYYVYCSFSLSLFSKGKRNGIEWIERDCLSKIPSIPLFRSLIGTNEATRECSFHSLLSFPSKNGRNTEIPILSLF